MRNGAERRIVYAAQFVVAIQSEAFARIAASGAGVAPTII